MGPVIKITIIIVAFNATTLVWIALFQLPPITNLPSRIENSPMVSPYEYQYGAKKCMRNIILFGMRQHWLVFCRYRRFARFKHLINYPRFIDCPETKCSIFLNYTEEPRDITGYDAVVFTNVYPWMTNEMWNWVHGNRSNGQRWILMTEESPIYSPGVQPPPKYENSTFDWYGSYKSDSDFVHPYGFYLPFGDVRPPKDNLKKVLHAKKRMLAWMASHCETLQWNRYKFVNDLEKIIQIDTYGKCGNEEVPWNGEDILLKLFRKYKFYLSLENSCCDEYITEKFWRALQMGIVPIVVGAPLEHYIKVAPPNSFIHVDHFDSMAELAIYLVELDGNDDKYLEYFKWRMKGRLFSVVLEEQYVRPLTNETHCEVLKKSLNTDQRDQRKRHYFDQSWGGSCKLCGTKEWVNYYMHPSNFSRENEDIWAK